MTAWADVRSGLIRIVRLRQVVNPSAVAQSARSTVKPCRRARWVSAVQVASVRWWDAGVVGSWRWQACSSQIAQS